MSQEQEEVNARVSFQSLPFHVKAYYVFRYIAMMALMTVQKTLFQVRIYSRHYFYKAFEGLYWSNIRKTENDLKNKMGTLVSSLTSKIGAFRHFDIQMLRIGDRGHITFAPKQTGLSKMLLNNLPLRGSIDVYSLSGNFAKESDYYFKYSFVVKDPEGKEVTIFSDIKMAQMRDGTIKTINLELWRLSGFSKTSEDNIAEVVENISGELMQCASMALAGRNENSEEMLEMKSRFEKGMMHTLQTKQP